MHLLISGLVGFTLGIIVTVTVVTAGWLAPLSPPAPKDEWGSFPVSAKVELLDDGRQLKLLEDFVYVDPRGRAWTAGKDSIVNGASIPKALWSITGGPLEGKYRNASIVHDEGCVKMTEPSERVHLMFYEACRCGGVPEYQAKVLYAAVYHFGPKWTIKQVMETRMATLNGKEEVVPVSRTMAMPERSTEDPPAEVLEKFGAYIKDKNPSLSDIENLKIDSL
ncbi:MAG: DUF1353 domain-containing protein [Planctomycetia bacterium]